jgi:hypothetical protein
MQTDAFRSGRGGFVFVFREWKSGSSEYVKDRRLMVMWARIVSLPYLPARCAIVVTFAQRAQLVAPEWR